MTILNFNFTSRVKEFFQSLSFWEHSNGETFDFLLPKLSKLSS